MGWWGEKMLNVPEAAPAEIRVVRAVDPNIEIVRAVCAENGVPLTADCADALADPQVKAVVLATPHALHDAQIEAAVAAGKHVFCEKPVALDKAAAATFSHNRFLALNRNNWLLKPTRLRPPA
jgi:predicted dehydrogenase